MRKLVYNVGNLDVDYKVWTVNPKFKCPFYAKWLGILTRCYSPAFLKTHPSYQGCKVCEDWLYFSRFKKWMEKQDWEGKALDKDLIGDGKLYSPETCVFIDQSVNNFLLTNDKRRGKFPIGVTFEKGKYRSDIKRDGRSICLGRFFTPEEAHKRWQIEKKLQVEVMFSHIDDDRVKQGIGRILENLQDDILNGRITLKL